MSHPLWKPSRRDVLRLGALSALGAAVPGLASCGGDSATGGGGGGTKQLQFMYWGSTFEQKAVNKMLSDFESDHPGVKVKPLFTPSDYETKLNTLVASNRAPDVAYMGDSTAFRLAESGKLVNFYDYLDKYPALAERLPGTYFWYGEDKLLGTQTANEIYVLWYNKQTFSDAGVAVPPAEAAKAWSWDDFVANAYKLTLDQNGKRPDENGFDPKKIRQFGCSFGMSNGQMQAMLESRGVSFFDDKGTTCLLDTPEAIEVFQNVADLSYKHHVAPTSVQLGNNAPSTTVQLQTKRIAMAVDGQWTLLDLGESNLDFSLGVLPKYGKPITTSLGGATVMFSGSKHPDEAMELYMYHNDVDKVDLFASGLWMPLDKKSYTDQAAIDSWTKNDVHPAEYRTAAVDYTLNNSLPLFSQGMKNMDAINKVMAPAIQQIDQGKKPAAEVLKPLAKKLNGLLKGRYPAQQL
ncbi:hypothetical protein GCM10009841_20530 [Microlunatus panaciterrae]|uniref:Multiple sugar transport system substrate-binding protein n=1 Tax=Microlunatus panaciterrae TaxID=400768 RepID=A0ABS2RPU7_9ACTN|nr:sugar ABC transporter substrate-binding protein [Microlunatus panaciterrae]MBM7800607.1 multiple sugar transport system substrate-binding protein [Microlunatus panaciterrae]